MHHASVFLTRSRRISLLAACALATPLTWALVATGETSRVSVDSAGVEANGSSYNQSISADGRFVAFSSSASNLVAGDTNGSTDIFIHDRHTGETARVSVDSAGGEGNAYCYSPTISAGGRFVAFSCYASNLVAGDANDSTDIFVHDRHNGETARVSVDSAGGEGNAGSYKPSISADGRYIAFASYASNLVTGDANRRSDIFVHDRDSGKTSRVSVDSAGMEANNSSFWPSISADGRFVAFYSDASNLVAGDGNGAYDIFIHDRDSGETSRVSVDSVGQEGDYDSYNPSISADGRFVAFDSDAGNLAFWDANNAADVFVHDRDSGETTRVSANSNGEEGNNSSYWPSISADGRTVAFRSYASNLVARDTNRTEDIFVHHLDSGETLRASVDSAGMQANADSYNPSISADGRFVAFGSYANNLVTGDTNSLLDIMDIFVKALTAENTDYAENTSYPDAPENTNDQNNAGNTATDAFVDQLDVEPGVLVESNEIIISGLDSALPLKIRNSGVYSLNGGEYTRDTKGVSVSNGDRLRVRHNASTKSGGSMVTLIKFGDTKLKFTSTTYAIDTTPDPVNFTNAMDVPTSTLAESNTVMITGINVAASIHVRSGEYRINGGSYKQAPGTVNNGDTVQVRHVSAAKPGKLVRTTLRVGSTKLRFISTTE